MTQQKKNYKLIRLSLFIAGLFFIGAGLINLNSSFDQSAAGFSNPTTEQFIWIGMIFCGVLDLFLAYIFPQLIKPKKND